MGCCWAARSLPRDVGQPAGEVQAALSPLPSRARHHSRGRIWGSPGIKKEHTDASDAAAKREAPVGQIGSRPAHLINVYACLANGTRSTVASDLHPPVAKTCDVSGMRGLSNQAQRVLGFTYISMASSTGVHIASPPAPWRALGICCTRTTSFLLFRYH